MQSARPCGSQAKGHSPDRTQNAILGQGISSLEKPETGLQTPLAQTNKAPIGQALKRFGQMNQKPAAMGFRNPEPVRPEDLPEGTGGSQTGEPGNWLTERIQRIPGATSKLGQRILFTAPFPHQDERCQSSLSGIAGYLKPNAHHRCGGILVAMLPIRCPYLK